MTRITLPWAVLAQVNHRLVRRRGGKGLTLSSDYRAKKDAAEMMVQAQVQGDRPRYDGPVVVELDFYEPDRRRRDPSNLLKLIEDCMAGTVYADDSQIVALEWRRAGLDRDEPRVEITIRVQQQEAA